VCIINTKTEFILNTIAFAEQLQSGVSQLEVIPAVTRMGFQAVEIRNEFLAGNVEELHQIRDEAQKNKLNVYYSVNDSLFINQGINRKLTQYIAEMHELGADHLKLNFGQVSEFNDELVSKLSEYLDGSFELNVENNQTASESKLIDIAKFFKVVQNLKIDIGFCFDSANWYWTGSTPEEAAVQLASVTRYLHLKNKRGSDEKLSVTPLIEGDIDWKKLVKSFPDVREVALEYAGTQDEVQQGLQAIKKEYLN